MATFETRNYRKIRQINLGADFNYSMSGNTSHIMLYFQYSATVSSLEHVVTMLEQTSSF